MPGGLEQYCLNLLFMENSEKNSGPEELLRTGKEKRHYQGNFS